MLIGGILAVIGSIACIDMILNKNKSKLYSILWGFNLIALVSLVILGSCLEFSIVYVIISLVLATFSALFTLLLINFVPDKVNEQVSDIQTVMLSIGDIPFFSIVLFTFTLSFCVYRIMENQALSAFPFFPAIVMLFFIYRIIASSIKFNNKISVYFGKKKRLLVIVLLVAFGGAIVSSGVYALVYHFANIALVGVFPFIILFFLPYILYILKAYAREMKFNAKDVFNADFEEYQNDFFTQDRGITVAADDNIIDAEYEEKK